MAAFCTSCAAVLEPGVKFCASCGAPAEVSPPTRPGPAAPTSAAKDAGNTASSVPKGARRYPALRIVAIVLKVAAVIWLVVGVIAFITALAMGSDLPAAMGAASGLYGFLMLLTSAYFAVMSWAGAELLHVFMDIEENTRRAAAN
jgi:zinc-ribbon domain